MLFPASRARPTYIPKALSPRDWAGSSTADFLLPLQSWSKSTRLCRLAGQLDQEMTRRLSPSKPPFLRAGGAQFWLRGGPLGTAVTNTKCLALPALPVGLGGHRIRTFQVSRCGLEHAARTENHCCKQHIRASGFGEEPCPE